MKNKLKYYEKQLLIEITHKLHKDIKDHAEFRNITIKAWVIEAIMNKILWEKQYE